MQREEGGLAPEEEEEEEGGKKRRGGREISGGRGKGRTDGGVGENGPRGVAARARVWTDGSPAWEPCSSCEERKGTGRGRSGEDGGGRKRRRVEGGGVGGGGGDDDGDGAHRRRRSFHTFTRRVLGGRGVGGGGRRAETTGAKFFRGRSCNVPHRLATLALQRHLLCFCSFHSSLPSRCLGALPPSSVAGAIISY